MPTRQIEKTLNDQRDGRLGPRWCDGPERNITPRSGIDLRASVSPVPARTLKEKCPPDRLPVITRRRHQGQLAIRKEAQGAESTPSLRGQPDRHPRDRC